ncbi:FGGY-family carbohydrate kinase [Brevibacillus massiliensis]|uniref:FGGY-family carbohydrate kinase n=1 Tax=Brevibacillus massiliensis TaxID=1118054 RepID=UPI0002EFD29A|nr:FGGY family carbohydrate kinase [Brevibacillus massiliensis]
MITLGIDVGTQGARVAAVREDGELLAHASVPLPAVAEPRPGWREQRAEDWWQAVSACLGAVTEELHLLGGGLVGQVKAIAVSSTSGTIVPVDRAGRALRPALMYNDSRSAAEAAEASAAGRALEQELGYRFSSSFALPKCVWLSRHEPSVCERTAKFLHAADYIVGSLTGVWDVTDYSNALKTGYDLLRNQWPPFLFSELGLNADKFPRVVAPGTVIAPISRQTVAAFGLAADTVVAAGMTDGCLGQLASGARQDGDWTSTIGTTFILKGLTDQLLRGPGLYSHLHPDGWWMPGGASNCGGAVLNRLFGKERLAALDRQAELSGPSTVIVYPLVQCGERFPFQHDGATGFVLGEPKDEADLYRGCLEGMALVERLALEVVQELGAKVNRRLYTTGGAAKSAAWMQIRADVLQMELCRPKWGEPAVGAAVLAAKAAGFASVSEAAGQMVRVEPPIQPDVRMASVYREKYARFKEECRLRGYLDKKMKGRGE